MIAFYRYGKRLSLPDYDDQLFSSSYGRVREIPPKHRVVLHDQRD